MDKEYSQFGEEWKPQPSLPLQAAVSRGDHAELERLLKISDSMVNQYEKNPFNSPSSTPLGVAVANNDITSVKILLDHGADPQLRLHWDEEEGGSASDAVCEAAALGFLEVLRLLIGKGGCMISRVLYRAASSGKLECVKEVFAWLANNERGSFDDGVPRGPAVAYELQLAAAAWIEDVVEFILTDSTLDQKGVDYALLRAILPEPDMDETPIHNCVRRGP
ncbi:hypothetical protein ONS95_002004 [Cadophora gregata]|uniref:uncharacterized protein n=1 Tax=Cadophora gregata TaxID=51156 RepID=UPI0026DC6870|nr:uncharacterized protein ONS95_002004 [Cadophora gregata]KAK0111659.1 hypothetical protein ONS95_002004 [Cadophora gregata]